MGKQKYRKEIEQLFRRSPVVSYSSISRIVGGKRGSKFYAKQLVHDLTSKGAIKKLAKGYYTISDDPSLIVYCFKPAYLGLQDAISFHNLWEQETVPIVITSQKIRPGIRKVLGTNVLIRRIDKRYMFGFGYNKAGDLYIPYSDAEKTFIDMIYFRQHIDKNLIKNVKSKIDKNRLAKYLKSYNKEIRKRVEANL